MRPSRTVAIAALTAALALGSLPGLAGSHEPSHDQQPSAAVFRQVVLAATGSRSTPSTVTPDSTYAAAGHLDPTAAFSQPGVAVAPADRVAVSVPAVPASWSWKTPRYKISGYATFYDNGTTAMRLPRGTVIVICGPGGCIDRVVNDYGPQKPSRIVDMYRPDFFAICGCGWWSGTVWATVSIY